MSCPTVDPITRAQETLHSFTSFSSLATQVSTACVMQDNFRARETLPFETQVSTHTGTLFTRENKSYSIYFRCGHLLRLSLSSLTPHSILVHSSLAAGKGGRAPTLALFPHRPALRFFSSVGKGPQSHSPRLCRAPKFNMQIVLHSHRRIRCARKSSNLRDNRFSSNSRLCLELIHLSMFYL